MKTEILKPEIIVALIVFSLSLICFILYKLWEQRQKKKKKKEERKRRNDLHLDSFFIPPTDSSHHISTDGEQFQGFGNGGSFGGGGASASWNKPELEVPDVGDASEGLLEGAGESLGNAAEVVGDAIGDVLGGLADGL